MARGRLGCGEYALFIRGRCGDKQRGALGTFQSLEWGRLQDDTSLAEVEIALAGEAGDACCELMSNVRTWHDNLAIFRNPGDLVWEGPLTWIETGRSTLKLRAHDVTAWLDERWVFPGIDHSIDSGDGPKDLTQIAREVILPALARDDPCVETSFTDSGIRGERKIEAYSQYAGDALRDLARTGIDFTALGRRIYVGLTTGLPQVLGVLREDHFLTDVTIVEDGLATGNRWGVEGKDAAIRGFFGDGDDYYGLHEKLAKEDSILDADSARVSAFQRWSETRRPPTYVVVPPNAQLSPEAPVEIGALVPGTLVNLDVASGCRQVQATQRLNSLTVHADAEGESVQLTLSPIGATTADAD